MATTATKASAPTKLAAGVTVKEGQSVVDSAGRVGTVGFDANTGKALSAGGSTTIGSAPTTNIPVPAYGSVNADGGVNKFDPNTGKALNPADTTPVQPTTPINPTTPVAPAGTPQPGTTPGATPVPNTPTQNKYKTATDNANAATGGTAPQNSPEAKTQGAGYMPPEAPSTTGVDSMLAQDKGYQQLLADHKAFNDAQTQQTSLTDEYKKLTQTAGIDQINTELVNMKNVINGTEDDIRNEVQAASGFASDSQVMALASSRNKQLIKNYNTLLDTKTAQMDYINTMIGLQEKDRSLAHQSLQDRMQFTTQENDYRDKFISNAREGYNNYIKLAGVDGLYNSIKSDPSTVSKAEQILGVPAGALATGAATAAKDRAMEQQKASLQNKVLESNLLTDKAQRAKIYSDMKSSGASGLDAPELIAYANQYASTGEIPTGLPKGTFGVVAQYAKESPKAQGTLIDVNTGVKPKLKGVTEDGAIALYDLTKKTAELATLRTGPTDKTLGSTGRTQYNALKSEIVDLLARARSGAALTADEVANYNKKIPNPYGLIPSFGNQKLETLSKSLNDKLNTTLAGNGAAIVGYSKVKVNGEDRTVGEVLDIGGKPYRVLADGQLTDNI